MSDDQITIEVDGKSFPARKGQMLIEVTDANDIYVPRFCYHSKLTVAANCRMCLVEVEKAPKALPACATPVMDGMVVRTQSKIAVDAQKSIMEFLLINHPLDCPICDQGGECELQDLAMGYGQDVSRYNEKKRVVKDKNIGPLIQTDLTRCIHCTRCVRFGEEIAGLREMGATGRGENMTIGTYIEKSVDSEMSGNIIDLCPVGALTSKPFRYSARTWELIQRDTIAPHDSVGSNIHVHVKAEKVMRVVPAANESINEVWLSDRDRFSYEAIYSEERLHTPMIKQDGQWHEVDWETALNEVKSRLTAVIQSQGTDKIGALASPSSTLEELYLFQKFVRALNINNIDSRLRQCDFSDQSSAPLYPSLDIDIAELESIDAALLIGSNVRKEQPIINHRLRKAALHGAAISMLNPIDYDFNYPVNSSLIVSPSAMLAQLAGVLKAIVSSKGESVDDEISAYLDSITVTAEHEAIAKALCDAEKPIVFLGNIATAHPQFASLRNIAGSIAKLSKSKFGYLSEHANTSGAWLSGVLPHRTPGGNAASSTGLDINTMFESDLAAYLLLNMEPELDCWNSLAAQQAMQKAELVIAMTPFQSEAMKDYADIMLPVAVFAETSGTYINNVGTKQSFSGVSQPVGEARPAWKVLRVMGNYFDMDGFAYQSSTDVLNEAEAAIGDTAANTLNAIASFQVIEYPTADIERITDVPMNNIDSICRRATALQASSEVADGNAHINSNLASQLGLVDGDNVNLQQGDEQISLPVLIDERLPDNSLLIHAGQTAAASLGPSYGSIRVSKQ